MRTAAVYLFLACALTARAETINDPGIDLKELEPSAAASASPAAPAQAQAQPAPQSSPAADPAPAASPAVVAPVIKPLALLQPPNPMPLQWVPNGAPKDSELMDSLPTGTSFTVGGIASQGDAYVAIVEYKGSSYVVQPGTMVPDQDDPAFQIRAITPSRVEAFDPVERRLVRRSLPPPYTH